MSTLRTIVCRVSNPVNEGNDEFNKVIEMFEDAGYEIAWESQGYTACVIKVEEE